MLAKHILNDLQIVPTYLIAAAGLECPKVN